MVAALVSPAHVLLHEWKLFIVCVCRAMQGDKWQSDRRNTNEMSRSIRKTISKDKVKDERAIGKHTPRLCQMSRMAIQWYAERNLA